MCVRQRANPMIRRTVLRPAFTVLRRRECATTLMVERGSYGRLADTSGQVHPATSNGTRANPEQDIRHLHTTGKADPNAYRSYAAYLTPTVSVIEVKERHANKPIANGSCRLPAAVDSRTDALRIGSFFFCIRSSLSPSPANHPGSHPRTGCCLARQSTRQRTGQAPKKRL